MFLILIYVILVSSVSFFGSLYVKKYNKPDLLIGIYVSSVLMSNVLAYKIANYNLIVTSVNTTSATIIFAITFLITDIVNEYFGKKETLKMIGIAFLAQLIAIIFIQVSISMDSAPFWTDGDAFNRILANTPRLAISGIVTFVIVEVLDAYIFAYLKEITHGKYLWMRSVFSTIPAMTLDTVLFTIFAFYGILPVVPIMVGMILVKYLVAIVDVPFLYLNKYIIGKKS